MALALTGPLGLVSVFLFDVVDSAFGSPLVLRFNGGNSNEFSVEEISESGRFVSLGVAGGDEESVDGGDEGNCGCFFRLRELYVRWMDISFEDTRSCGEKTRRVSLVLFIYTRKNSINFSLLTSKFVKGPILNHNLQLG